MLKKQKEIESMFKTSQEILRIIRKEKAEYLELELSIHKQMNELNETIQTAKEYLKLCGYSESDLEAIRLRSKFKIL